MSVLSPRAQARQAQLIRRYIGTLSAKQARISDCWRQVRSSEWDSESLAQLKAEVHRLAGSAGSHGLAALGEAALAVESSLKAGCGSPGQRADLDHHLTRLLRALEAATGAA